MKQVVAIVLLVAFGALTAAVALADDCSTNFMHCTTDSKLQVNSFIVRASWIITRITVTRIHATQQLGAKDITAIQAQTTLKKTDKARALWDKARVACHATPSGNCDSASDSEQAYVLLSQAQEALE